MLLASKNKGRNGGIMPANRPEDQSPEAIQAALRRLENLLAGIAAAADEMREHRIASVRVSNYAALERAMMELNRWNRSIQNALTAELHEAGAFREPKKRPPKTK
jgi:hypothetical protein